MECKGTHNKRSIEKFMFTYIFDHIPTVLYENMIFIRKQ